MQAAANPVVAAGRASVNRGALPAWLEALRAVLARDYGVASVEVIETHISWVLLTGRHAYKIKKPVNLGFVDFSTLDKRRQFCEQELRLNRRLAPQLYLDVVTINGNANQLCVAGGGPVVDYAVRMTEFPKSALASAALEAGQLKPAHFDALATRIAAFHHDIGVAAEGSPFGTADSIYAAAKQNFLQLDPLMTRTEDSALLAELRAWTQMEYEARWTLFNARLSAGDVRECHGDLHLGNLVLLEGALLPFDCIEFNPALRWIDIFSEAAFLMMDLADRGHPALGWRFLNTYLDATGAHTGLTVLRFYLVYRALVRAKVHALRAAQPSPQAREHTQERERLFTAARHYLALAKRYAQHEAPVLILMHGLSGSGKSMVAQALADALGAVRLRSDVERKRLAGLAAHARSGSPLHGGIYSAGSTLATYGRLADLARLALNAGWHCVIDAAFLTRAQREQFRQLAAARGVRCLLIDVTAPESVLRLRIAARAREASDASEADQAVLAAQWTGQEALTAEEMRSVCVIDSTQGDAATVAAHAVTTVRARLAAHP